MTRTFSSSAGRVRTFRLRPTLIAAAMRGALLSLAMGGAALPVAAQVQTAPSLPAGDAVHAFNVPAGPLDAALDRFARAAGVNLSYDAATLSGLSTQGLNGRYSVSTGLSALLAGSGLQAVAQAGGGYALRKLPAPPAEGGPQGSLPAVQVTARSASERGELPPVYAGGQVARGGNLGILGNTDVMDAPFSTTSYTSELIENQQARTLADIVVNDASGRVLTGSGGFGDDFQIRGFPVSSGDVGLNGLYGLVSASHMPVEMVERVDVLKGPGSFLNGIAPSGNIGGGINVVTKRAGDDPLTRVSAGYVSKGQGNVHADVGRRFGEDNVWGVRFNGVWRQGEASIDGGNQTLGLAAIGLDYTGSKLRWSLDAFTQKENVDEFRPQIGFAAGLTEIPSPPSARTNFYPGSTLTLEDTTVATNIEYDIDKTFTAFGGIGYREGAAEQLFPITGGVNAQGDFSVMSSYYDSYTNTTSLNAGVRARFNTGPVGHTLTLSATDLNQIGGYAYIADSTAAVPNSNIYNPQPLKPIGLERTAPRKSSDTTLTSVAVVDTLSFNRDQWLLTLGARDQKVDVKAFSTTTGLSTSHYKSSAVTPLAGIVFKPVDYVSLYANYTEGLTPGTTVAPPNTNQGEVLAPYKSKQYEAGVKVDWGSLTSVASVFQIARPSAQTDPVTGVYGYDGEQRNRGLELSLYGEVVRGLRILTSAVFNDAKLTRTASAATQGNDAPGVPDRTFSLSVDWDTPWVTGLSLNARAIYTSSVPFNATNTLQLDSWTRYDIGARYRTVIANTPTVFRASIENLFDKNYWLTSGTYATVAAPRTYILSATVDF
ncbi:MAG: TonB-dependent receptor [Rhodocyclaceae bacterium]